MNSVALAGVVACYLSISWCALFRWKEKKKKRFAFLARNAFLALLLPPLSFSDPDEYQVSQVVNLTHFTVSLIVVHTLDEETLGRQISQGISLMGFLARTVQNILLAKES